jgi:hypothetical protein
MSQLGCDSDKIVKFINEHLGGKNE